MPSTLTDDDLAYVRQLSESGARAPLIGGRFMAWWGLMTTLAWIAQHFGIRGAFGDGGGVFVAIWSTYALLGVAGQILLVHSMPDMSGGGSAGNLASRSVWTAGSAVIGSMAVGAILLSGGEMGSRAYDWIVPVAFAVYACALIVSGSLAAERVATVAGYGAVSMVGLSAAVILDPNRYLVAAAGAAATVLLPGLILMAREPRARG